MIVLHDQLGAFNFSTILALKIQCFEGINVQPNNHTATSKI